MKSLLVSLLFLELFVALKSSSFRSERCELITIKLCKDMPYNKTRLPNSLGHTTQYEAGNELHQYYPLIKMGCSPYLKVFLCTLLSPVCTNYPQPLKPCQSLCLAAKKKCEDVLQSFGASWPSHMDCSLFPTPDKEVCVSQNETKQTYQPKVHNASLGGRSFRCPPQLRVPPRFGYKLRVGNVEAKGCGLPCSEQHDYFFGAREESIKKRNFAKIWIFVWSLLCSISTLFTSLTFVIDRARFKYPERPIIFLSACYFMVSICYVVGFFLKDKAVCSGPFRNKLEEIDEIQLSLPLITQGTKLAGCSILFMVIYFFSMASCIWWVVLAFTWFLAAGLKWGHEAIESNAHFFHILAWVVPAVKTIAILALGQIDGDVLSGVCFTGLSNLDTLRGFIITPLLVYLVLGTSFLLAGFVSLCRIRTAMKADGSRTDKLDKLIMRIGVFSVLYTLPAVIVIVCHFYEHNNRLDWMKSWHARACQMGFSCPPIRDQLTKPEFTYFMLKYLMMLIVGVTSGFWIWSTKTLNSWKNAYHKLFKGRKLITEANV